MSEVNEAFARVVEVLREMLAAGQALPPSLGGVPVDVRQLSPSEAAADEVGAFDRAQFFITGTPPPVAEATEAAPVTSYEKWEKHPLNEVRVASITCHVSPDAGLEQLRDFLAGTSERLTVAIYDFHSEEVFDALLVAASAAGTLNLIIDPDRKKPDETTEGEFKQRLKDELDEGFKEWSWAATGGTKPLFLNSYHTKVTVRDRCSRQTTTSTRRGLFRKGLSLRLE